MVRRRRGEQPAVPLPALADVPALLPVPFHAEDDPGRGRRVAGGHGPAVRGPEVGVLAGDPVVPLRALGTAQSVVGAFGERGEVRGVAAEQPVVGCRAGQPFARVRPDGLQHGVPGPVRGVLDAEQVPVDQSGQPLGEPARTVAGRVGGHADGGDGLGRAPAREDGQAGQQLLVVGVQQREAPVHGGAQRALPGR